MSSSTGSGRVVGKCACWSAEAVVEADRGEGEARGSDTVLSTRRAELRLGGPSVKAPARPPQRPGHVGSGVQAAGRQDALTESGVSAARQQRRFGGRDRASRLLDPETAVPE